MPHSKFALLRRCLRPVTSRLVIAILPLLLQFVPAPGFAEVPVSDFLFVVDVSKSMIGEPAGSGNKVVFPDLQKHIGEFIRSSSLPSGSMLTVVTFDEKVRQRYERKIGSDADREDAANFVAGLRAEGQRTHIYQTLAEVWQTVVDSRSSGNRANPIQIFVYTDGLDNSRPAVPLSNILKRFNLERGANDHVFYHLLNTRAPNELKEADKQYEAFSVADNATPQPIRVVAIQPESLEFPALDRVGPRSLATAVASGPTLILSVPLGVTGKLGLTAKMSGLPGGAAVAVDPVTLDSSLGRTALTLEVLNLDCLAPGTYDGEIHLEWSGPDRVYLERTSIPFHLTQPAEKISVSFRGETLAPVPYGSAPGTIRLGTFSHSATNACTGPLAYSFSVRLADGQADVPISVAPVAGKAAGADIPLELTLPDTTNLPEAAYGKRRAMLTVQAQGQEGSAGEVVGEYPVELELLPIRKVVVKPTSLDFPAFAPGGSKSLSTPPADGPSLLVAVPDGLSGKLKLAARVNGLPEGAVVQVKPAELDPSAPRTPLSLEVLNTQCARPGSYDGEVQLEWSGTERVSVLPASIPLRLTQPAEKLEAVFRAEPVARLPYAAAHGPVRIGTLNHSADNPCSGPFVYQFQLRLADGKPDVPLTVKAVPGDAASSILQLSVGDTTNLADAAYGARNATLVVQAQDQAHGQDSQLLGEYPIALELQARGRAGVRLDTPAEVRVAHAKRGAPIALGSVGITTPENGGVPGAVTLRARWESGGPSGFAPQLSPARQQPPVSEAPVASELRVSLEGTKPSLDAIEGTLLVEAVDDADGRVLQQARTKVLLEAPLAPKVQVQLPESLETLLKDGSTADATGKIVVDLPAALDKPGQWKFATEVQPATEGVRLEVEPAVASIPAGVLHHEQEVRVRITVDAADKVASDDHSGSLVVESSSWAKPVKVSKQFAVLLPKPPLPLAVRIAIGLLVVLLAALFLRFVQGVWVGVLPRDYGLWFGVRRPTLSGTLTLTDATGRRPETVDGLPDYKVSGSVAAEGDAGSPAFVVVRADYDLGRGTHHLRVVETAGLVSVRDAVGEDYRKLEVGSEIFHGATLQLGKDGEQGKIDVQAPRYIFRP